MVNFVKPSLLGTRKEFMNRFVNPIVNGQHSDSMDRDIRIMKKRSFILNDLLKVMDGMGWDYTGCDGMGWDGMGWDGMGWDGLDGMKLE